MKAKTAIYFSIAFLAIFFAFTLMNWLFSFSGSLFSSNIFQTSNPLGVLGIIAVLSIGGFYVFKIGFEVLKNSV
ncbi:MAG: hypothetical protein HYW50_04085 [Candidatus Diapherotrites archaeon]|nr:hypothetical protein [Candidatus Diapherotrites archaeon]